MESQQIFNSYCTFFSTNVLFLYFFQYKCTFLVLFSVQMFTKVIEAPACNRIVLTVLGFDLFRRQSDDRCSVEGLEIRLFDPVTSGSWHCGTELSAGTQFKSGSNKTVLFYMKSAMTINTNMGFSLNATFEDIPGCTP